MTGERFDAVVVGAGYAGSLTAMLLSRRGWRVAVVERGRHPRFAIGESSTPAADLLLRRLGETYDLPELVELSSYGRWRESRPELGCGPKRGFAYFRHDLDREFRFTPDHDTELLVAASVDEPSADLHWLREDVDAFLADRAVAAGAMLFDRTEITRIEAEANGWSVELDAEESACRRIEAGLLLDASGPGRAIARFLGLEERTFRTNTRAVFAHFADVRPWADVLAAIGAPLDDHPFPCDQAALHHVFDGGWMWQLRFDDGTTSAGFVVDNKRNPPRNDESPADEWTRWLGRLPTVSRQFDRASVVRPEEGIGRIARVQSGYRTVAGNNWALLPGTAGFVDPLHSTGIAHAVHGIARLVERLTATDAPRSEVLAEYGESLEREIDFIDLLVSTGYRAAPEEFFATTLPYFVAATRWESRFQSTGNLGSFLDADSELPAVIASLDTLAWATVESQLRPFDTIRVLDCETPHMYPRAATKTG